MELKRSRSHSRQQLPDSLYGHNNSPFGHDAVSKNTQAQFVVPSESGRSVVVNGLIWSDNARPNKYWDRVILTCEKKFHLEVVDGSPHIESNGGVGGDEMSMSIVNGWAPVGYDALDGDVPDCYWYDFYLSVEVRVVADE